MDATTSATVVLVVMVVGYGLAKWLKLSTELSMVVAAIAGGLAAGFGVPARHIAEGAMTYLDINLIFFTATLFMNILKESGGVAFVVRGMFKRFHQRRAILLVMLTILLLIPGALTGAELEEFAAAAAQIEDPVDRVRAGRFRGLPVHWDNSWQRPGT